MKSRKNYNHIITTGIFNIADKVAAFRKPNQPKQKKKK